MNNILEKIINRKFEEVAEAKKLRPTATLEKSIHFERECFSLRDTVATLGSSGVIAEIKRRSPSRPSINLDVNVEQTALGYAQAGAAGISVLTDADFFGGSNADLLLARAATKCPILRKDFTIDEYQILEAKSIGADAILLIAAALDPKRLKNLADFAKSLGLDVLMEVHNRDELDACLHHTIDLVGVNNRNLKTFETKLEMSIELAEAIPDDFVKVSESGLSKPVAIIQLKQYGYRGFLIGEHFMRQVQPALACEQFIADVRRLEIDQQNSPLWV